MGDVFHPLSFLEILREGKLEKKSLNDAFVLVSFRKVQHNSVFNDHVSSRNESFPNVDWMAVGQTLGYQESWGEIEKKQIARMKRNVCSVLCCRYDLNLSPSRPSSL
ncbi:hypothetical protein AVEN_119678-1 [Araneus ventricosus]|uniref:Uncharacterized protein n=1 Tax=Araneus ventricosus TaxID=182803 RepID=A0A4Y2KJF7_ARAVE|nr:hypothetical protein AVEN_119678-1 [Araneus ventricosus]